MAIIENKTQKESIKSSVNRKFNDIIREKHFNKRLNLIANPEMRLFGVYEEFFTSYDELIEFCQSKDIPLNMTFIIDYIRSFGGYFDVIRKIQKNGNVKYSAAINEKICAILNLKKSLLNDVYVWDYKKENLKNKYKIFQDRGVILENSIYPELSEENPVLKREK